MSIVMNVKCPRCGKEHTLETKQFAQPMVDPDPSDPSHPCTYQEWAICPETGEPILFKVPDRDDVLIPLPPPAERVAELAYCIWQAGSPDHLTNWLAAERLLTTYFRVRSLHVVMKEADKEIKESLMDRTREIFQRAMDDRVAAKFSYLLEK